MISSVNLTMAESIRQPDELVLAGNIAENLRKFKQVFELYIIILFFYSANSRMADRCAVQEI